MKTMINVLEKPSIRKIVLSILFLSIISIFPLYIHNQWVTGPLVNAIIILTCLYIGSMEAIMFGLIPSTIALSSGLLPSPLAPMVPFIMISNALFVAIFYYLKKFNYFSALIISAIIKSAFLFGVVNILMNQFLNEKFITELSIMMSWPQLITALVGGIIAYIITKKYPNE